jgi:hypothetical protein
MGIILITTPVFGDSTPSIARQLREVVRMAVGTTVFRIRIELIFRRCWNLVTPSRSFRALRPIWGVPRISGCGLVGASRRHYLGSPQIPDSPAAFLESCTGYSVRDALSSPGGIVIKWVRLAQIFDIEKLDELAYFAPRKTWVTQLGFLRGEQNALAGV